MLEFDPEGFFRFWMISRSPYSWFKIISIGWAFFHHKPLSSFLLYHFFLVFLHIISLSFLVLSALIPSLSFIFFIIISLYISSNKKIGFPLFLHVLHPCFKIFKCKNFTQFNLLFQISSMLFFLFSSRWIYFLSFCTAWVNRNILSLEIFSGGGWCRSWIKCIAFVFSWLEAGQHHYFRSLA